MYNLTCDATDISSPYTPSPQQYLPGGGLILQTAPVSQVGSQIFTPPIANANAPQVMTTPSTPGPNCHFPDSRPHLLSRDSRISLPDEAKQFIANMADSPVPSPRLDGFAKRGSSPLAAQPETARSENAGGLAPPVCTRLGGADSPGGTSEFLDMNEDDDGESEADDERSAVTGTELEYDGSDAGLGRNSSRQPPQSIPQGVSFCFCIALTL